MRPLSCTHQGKQLLSSAWMQNGIPILAKGCFATSRDHHSQRHQIASPRRSRRLAPPALSSHLGTARRTDGKHMLVASHPPHPTSSPADPCVPMYWLLGITLLKDGICNCYILRRRRYCSIVVLFLLAEKYPVPPHPPPPPPPPPSPRPPLPPPHGTTTLKAGTCTDCGAYLSQRDCYWVIILILLA